MSAPARVNPKLPNGRKVVLRKDVADALGFEILNRDGTVRDLTTDTLTVSAKLDTVAKTLAVA